ncbi:hypothetical protein HYALB_00002075 [Hymenoscyphus albidus]|uniref:Glycoside hydrolase family 78 protein n=1 Tax=Hymenoscyphus albidus TaxID=595503 RepID=A0A9N9Q2W4_9HELO|nr:hypothetical protein HYALB_00002075 [Hymenoscyphus albidus]
MMFLAAFLITLGVLLTQNSHGTLAMASNPVGGCWRDTPCTGPATAAFPGSWDKYNYSPTSRTLAPAKIYSATKQYIADYPFPLNFKGNNQILIFDFGVETGGIVHINYAARGSGQLGLAFSEARNWTGTDSDSTNGSFQPDGAIYADITPTTEANYTMPIDKIRGGFRYLTVFTKSNNAAGHIEVDISDIYVEIGYQPAWSNLRAYQGYFSSSDDLLNKIWYAGAFTLQTNAIPPSTGRVFPILNGGWENNQQLNIGTNDPTIYVDGSKRDRTVWPGDLTIAIISILVSTGDTAGVRNTLQVLYNDQAVDGGLPFAGPGINIYNSDTYHMATLIGTHDYFLYTNDKAWLSGVWDRYKKAMAFITAKVDNTGSIYVTGTDDWGRVGQGAHNTEAQMIMYKTLVTGSSLATWQGEADLAKKWTDQAATIKGQINSVYWDASAGAYKNSDVDASIYPQDANSMALAFSAADASKMGTISKSLTKNWGPIGAVCPELPKNIVAFVQSFEIKGHLIARQASRALDLIRRSWGWYLNHPDGTGSTTIEGYLADGTFGYRSEYGYANDYSYTSHAHGWGTGPTDALTSLVVGLRVTQPAGSSWELAPQFGDLSHAEAGFVTPLGKFAASWTLFNGGYSLGWSAPAGTKGALVLPGNGSAQPKVAVEGGMVKTEQAKFDGDSSTLIMEVEGDGNIRVTF